MMNMKITLLTGRTFDISREAGFDIKVVESARARRLSLRIDTKNRIPILTIPRFCPKSQALAFVKKQKAWIEEKLQKIPEQRYFAAGDKISFNGIELEIRHCPEMRGGVIIEDGFLKVSGEKSFLARRVRDFIKNRAQKILHQMSVEKAAQINCKVNRVVIKDTKSRWGSCSALRNINYNWRIMLAPAEVIDYLVAHEVAHLIHPDHSRAFWRCVADLAQNAEAGRQWLKKNGAKLNEYI